MAAFSSEKHHPFLLDYSSSSSLFLFPNTNSANLSPTTITNNSNMSCFQNNYFSPLHHHHPFYDPTVDHVSSSINNISSTTTAKGTTCCSNNSSSSVVTAPHQLINPIHKRNNNFLLPHSKMNQKKQRKSGSNNSSIDEGCTMRSEGGEEKMTCKKKGKRGDDQKKKKKKEIEKEAPTGYIHVRARRGQATDSHSLAERVRREKISERMKVLQALVPGCDKVTGKALMLDEIINYVQSLQNQVEFLSMKIASVNPMLYDFGMDLDAVMVKPELQTKSLEAAEEENHCNQLDTTNIFNYTLMDSSSLLQFQQAQMPNVMSHLQSNNGQLLWNMNEHRQI